MSLLRQQEEQRKYDRQEFASWVEGVRVQAAREAEATRDLIRAHFAEVNRARDEQTDRIVAVMEKVMEVVGIPAGDTPTVEELLAEARTDPARRKLVEQAMNELEFADTEIDFN